MQEWLQQDRFYQVYFKTTAVADMQYLVFMQMINATSNRNNQNFVISLYKLTRKSDIKIFYFTTSNPSIHILCKKKNPFIFSLPMLHEENVLKYHLLFIQFNAYSLGLKPKLPPTGIRIKHFPC